jgi:hypothetical protein
MKNVILMVAVLVATQAPAQVSILDILPPDVAQEVEVLQLPIADEGTTGDTSVYTYQIDVIHNIDNLVFVEHRVDRFTNAKVYKIAGTSFKLRLVTPDKDDEIQDPFIHVYRNDI